MRSFEVYSSKQSWF